MTKEFLDDFNITDMNQAATWTIGFDLGTAVPNSDPTSISMYQNIARGAPSTDNFPTRNGAINFGVADSYNTERIEFQRGPDTAMFGDGGPGGEQFLDHGAVRCRGHRIGEPVGIAGAGALAGDGVHVFDHGAQPCKWAAGGALERCLEIVRDEEAAHFDLPFCVPRYQSRIFSPLQQATPGFDKISSKVRSTCLMRCVCPDR